MVGSGEYSPSSGSSGSDSSGEGTATETQDLCEGGSSVLGSAGRVGRREVMRTRMGRLPVGRPLGQVDPRGLTTVEGGGGGGGGAANATASTLAALAAIDRKSVV